MHTMIRAIATGAMLLITGLATVVVAADAGAPNADADVGIEAATPNPALGHLLRMAGFLSRLTQFSVVFESGYDVLQETGQKIEFGERRRVVLMRFDRLRIDSDRSDGKASTVVFDGESISVFDASRKLLASSQIEGNLDAAIIYFVRDLKMRLPLAMLLLTSLPQELEARVLEAEIVETALLDGQPFVHLAARTDSVDFQIWVPATGDPLPRRIIITYREDAGQPQYWANFSRWDLAPDAPASSFTIDIPEDVMRIPFLAETLDRVRPATETGETP